MSYYEDEIEGWCPTSKPIWAKEFAILSRELEPEFRKTHGRTWTKRERRDIVMPIIKARNDEARVKAEAEIDADASLSQEMKTILKEIFL